MLVYQRVIIVVFFRGPLFRFFCIAEESYESHPFIFDTPLLWSQSATEISPLQSATFCRRWRFPRRHGSQKKTQIIPVKDHDLVLKTAWLWIQKISGVYI